MKIISKFKDYYDSMRCYANPAYCSNDFTYIRKERELLIPNTKIHFILDHEGGNNNGNIIRHIIGFCGEWYFIYSIQTDDQYYNEKNQHLNYTFFASIQEVLRSNWNMKYIKKMYTSNSYGYSNIFQKHKKSTFKDTINAVIQSYIKYEKELLREYSIELNKLNLFEKHNAPAFEIHNNLIWHKATLVINPNLEKLAFYKILEGNIAYQEIEMFLSNELLPKDNPDQITDDLILATNHGFNKASFRKAPSKAEKRAKRKAHKLKKRDSHATTN